MNTPKEQVSHTPGPWKCDFPFVNTGDDYSIAEVYDTDRMDGRGSNEANARLIAAAPDLFEQLNIAALRLHQAAILLGTRPEAQWFLDYSAELRNVITKATKGQP